MWGTVESLAGLFDLDDDQLTWMLFETLDIDVGSALSEANLKGLIAAGVLSEAFAADLMGIGANASDLIRQAHVQKAFSAASIRASTQWAQVVGDCRELLARPAG